MSKSRDIINKIRELIDEIPDGSNAYIITVVHNDTDEDCPSFLKSGGNTESLAKLSEVLQRQVESLKTKLITQSLFTDAMNHFMNVLEPEQRDILFEGMQKHADDVMRKIMSDLGNKLGEDSDNDDDDSDDKNDNSSGKDDLDNYLRDIFN